MSLLILFLACQTGFVLSAGESVGTDSSAASPADTVSSASTSGQASLPEGSCRSCDLPVPSSSRPDDSVYDPPVPWSSGAESGAWMWRYSLSLIIVGALMVGVFCTLRRMRRALGGPGDQSPLRLIGRLPLDRHNTVFQIQTSKEILTLSSGTQGVELLSKEAAPEYPGETEGAAETGRPTFQNRLAALRRTPLSLILHGNAGERNST